MKTSSLILSIIVVSQFLCTSLWFAGNAVMNELVLAFQLDEYSLANLTSAVQFGFILGTLCFALFTIADRFSPSKVFFICALLGATSNMGMSINSNTFFSLFIFRFSTGFFLAGIYPVGMKIAADYFDKNLGKSLGLLVGALVLGTAFPHCIALTKTTIPWKFVIFTTSALAAFGGSLIYFLIPNGPYRKKSSKLQLNAVIKVFQNLSFRRATFGYFGHMWELYAFWTFIPLLLQLYTDKNPDVTLSISLWSFLIIAIGSLGCIVGGLLSLTWDEKRIARIALCISGFCCLISPFIFEANLYVFLIILLVWGLTVIMDSPLFSTLVAKNAEPEIKGTALTIVNCIGFALTIVSIQLLQYLSSFIEREYIFVFLAIGPILGVYALGKKTVNQSNF